MAGRSSVAILLPAGYNLGYVYMGEGNLWGLGELDLERVNREAVTYCTAMGNFFTEIERCIRMGVARDLLWDIDRPEGDPAQLAMELLRRDRQGAFRCRRSCLFG
jgi:hypothetical protein